MCLSLIKILYCDEVVSIIRVLLSDEPLMMLRESTLFLLELVTDLGRLPSDLLAFGTPAYRMLERAVLDFLFRGSANRSCVFLFTYFRPN